MKLLRVTIPLVGLMMAAGLTRADEDADKTKELLIGVWTLPNLKGVKLEFTKDGVVTYDSGLKKAKLTKGTYEVVGKDKIKVEYTEGGVGKKGKKAEVMIEVTKDSLKFDANLIDKKPNPNATPYVRSKD